MSTATASASVRDDIHQEHERIDVLMTELRWLLVEPSPGHLHLVKELMDELATLLDEHFAHEEDGGYFTELLEVQPEMTARVERLRQEHREMLTAVRAINRRLRSAHSTPLWFETIRSAFGDFTRLCEAHQHEENAMAQEGYLLDMGVGD